MDVLADITAIFDAAGARGYLHAREIAPRHSDGREVDLDADHPVSAASVIKVVFAVAFARAVAEGRLDPRTRVEVPAELRLGGSGTAGFADPALVSLRDLALLMMTVSDNAATDIIYAQVGAGAIAAVLSDLALTGTHVRSDMTSAHRSVAAELGFPDTASIPAWPRRTPRPSGRWRGLTRRERTPPRRAT
jgi:beta-lactamase class A